MDNPLNILHDVEQKIEQKIDQAREGIEHDVHVFMLRELASILLSRLAVVDPGRKPGETYEQALWLLGMDK